MLVAFFATMTNATWTPPAGMTERGELIGTALGQVQLDHRRRRHPGRGRGDRQPRRDHLQGRQQRGPPHRPATGRGDGPPPNNEPTFDQDLANRTSPEGTVVNLDAGATDPDGDPFDVRAPTNLPPGLSINTSTGLITGTIGATGSSASPYAVSITVRDGATVDATDTFSWTVTDVSAPNNEPTFDQDLATGPAPRAPWSTSTRAPPIPTATPRRTPPRTCRPASRSTPRPA